MSLPTLDQSVQRMLDSVLYRSTPLVLTSPTRWHRQLPHRPTWEESLPHAHRYFEIAFVDHGECCIVIEGVPCVLSKGNFCLLPPSAEHYEVNLDTSADYRLIWFCLKVPVVETFITEYTARTSSLQVERRRDAYVGGPVSELLQALIEGNDRDDPYFTYVKRGYLLTFLGTVAPQLRKADPSPHQQLFEVKDPIILAAIAYMKERLHDPDLTVGAVARHVAFSPNYFIGYFRERVGSPPYQYLVRLRMDEARRLLVETDLSVTDIAAQVGFVSPGHFTRTFKQTFDDTPSQFRSQARIHLIKME